MNNWDLKSKNSKVQRSNLYHFSFQAFFPVSCLWIFWWVGDTFSSYLAPFIFFRLYTNSLPAVLSTHLSLSFSACPSVSPPVSLITVKIINRLLCLVPQLLTSLHWPIVSITWNWMVFPFLSLHLAPDVSIVFLCVWNLPSFLERFERL